MSYNIEKEYNFLESASQTYKTNESSQIKIMRELIIKTFMPFIKKERIAVELGCDDGCITEMLSKIISEIDVIDGSKTFLEKASNRIYEKGITNVNFIYSLFEQINTNKKYDYVFATYILEHVVDPVLILKNSRNFKR